ncbi:MAG TPA: squalene--hopene cyclase [Bryobacteraceae bacterium]|nr:squalene--hopene cyclase [Bryobacteraceae bacterium]
MSSSTQTATLTGVGAAHAAARALEFLVGRQRSEGFWHVDLTADSTLESDYILLQLWLHPPIHGVWNPPARATIDRAVQAILARQLPDGGFNIYPSGPSEVNATVKAYFALKLAGLAENDTRLAAARDRILALGGIQACNSYVKINLSLFGLYPRKYTPSIPVEMILAGNFIYELSSWTRTIVIPLAIVQALNAGRPVPAGFTIAEIFKPGAPMRYRFDWSPFTWKNFFYHADHALKLWEKMGPKALRRRAIAKAEKWIVERTRYTDGLGAIYPPMQYTIMALDLLGYAPDHPDRAEAQQQFDRLMVARDDGEVKRFFFQPCYSVVWDTAMAAHAIASSAEAPKTTLERSTKWLLTKEVRRKGDWSVKRPNTEPSGWYFEYANEFYPDIDDTAMVLLAMGRANAPERAVKWLLDMQSKDGGWAAFDVDNDMTLLSEVPFADHNAMLDPTCPDITGRVLEALIAMGVPRTHAAIQRGVEYLKQAQQPDGSWWGRWGVCYIYGTFLALRGLAAAGESDREAYILRAGEWLRSIQNSDGGWGESCAAYDENTFAPGPSTPSQTAWAILGLIAGGDTTSLSLNDGIAHLVESQQEDGSWREDLATGTGFPRVFYLSYHMYRNSFPLLALNTFLKSREEADRLS